MSFSKFTRSFVAPHPADSSTSVQLVVTATQTITHDAYRAVADGNFSAVGEVPAVESLRH